MVRSMSMINGWAGLRIIVAKKVAEQPSGRVQMSSPATRSALCNQQQNMFKRAVTAMWLLLIYTI